MRRLSLFGKVNVVGASLVAIGLCSSVVTAQPSVELPSRAVAGVLSTCGSNCDAAVQKLVNRLIAQNARVDSCDIVATVASSTAVGYNRGSISAAAAKSAFGSIYSIAVDTGCTATASAAKKALVAVESGDQVAGNFRQGNFGIQDRGDNSGSPS